MRKRKLSNWVESWMEYMKVMQSPQRYNRWAAVGTIAAALGPQCWFSQDRFNWYVNMYLIFTGPAGAANKTTAINEGMKIWKLATGGERGPDKVTTAALLEWMGEKAVYVEVDDEGGMVDFSPGICAPDELGNFLDLHDHHLLDALVALYDVRDDPFKKITKTQGDNAITRPWLHIMGGVTPSWLASHFDNHQFEMGFASRCLFIYSEGGTEPSTYIKREIKKRAPDNHLLRDLLIHDLRTIHEEVRGEFAITEECMDWGEEWHHPLHKRCSEGVYSGAFATYMSRKQAHAHKIAMCLSAAESSDRVIHTRHLQGAVKMLDDIEQDMGRIHAYVANNGTGRVSDMVLKVLKKDSPMKKGDLFRRVMAYTTRRDFDECLRTLMLSKSVRFDAGSTTYIYQED